MKLIFATQNKHKIEEIKPGLNPEVELIDLSDMGFKGEVPETSDTLEGNALEKANFVFNKYSMNTLSDDTGLEVESLNGEPGIFSARYAGDSKNSEENIEKLLDKLKGKSNRKARFRTVIALILNNKEYLFEGIAEGEIVENRSGNMGFGYDPVFQPLGYDKTFAEMTLQEKNEISHRARALKKLTDFLNRLID
ncbi:MAG: non-canonical purine NTP diphosphatase [Bacteroidales bacterium]|nr:non-canonical purine NTP diphosphatase [Bacteroidales bacterium]